MCELGRWTPLYFIAVAKATPCIFRLTEPQISWEVEASDADSDANWEKIRKVGRSPTATSSDVKPSLPIGEGL